MPELTEHHLEGLRDGLKLAFSPRISSMLRGLGTGGGVGAAGGALLGAVAKGGKKYHEERQQGASVAEALGGSVGHAAGGALHGAMLGGAAGALGGGALGAARPELGKRLSDALQKMPGAQFGQRQVHTFTGWKPEAGLGSIGMGAATRKGALDQATKDWQNAATSGKGPRSIADRVLGRSAAESAEKRLGRAADAYHAGRKAEEMGLTSIPGYMKSLKKDPVGTLRAAANEQWKGMSPGMKALTVGAPAMEIAGALRGPEKDEHGRSRTERVANGALAAGGMLLSPLSLTGQLAVGAGLSHAAGAVGKLARPKKPVVMSSQAPDLTADSGQAVAGERHISDRAAGSMGGEGFSA